MEEASARKLRFVSLQVVGAVAVIHLIVGGAEFAQLSEAGLLWAYFAAGRALEQPEPWLFVLSGGAILVGIAGVAAGRIGHRRAYLLGIGMLSVYVLGWLVWHTVLEHGIALEDGATVGEGATGGDGGGHEHSSHEHGGDEHGAGADGGGAHLGVVSVVRTHYVEPMVGIATGANQAGRVTLSVVSKTLEAIGLLLLAALLSVDPRAQTGASGGSGAAPESPEAEAAGPEDAGEI
ncbi:hypothetical protein [Natronomonas sp.]|uniref:hypothetical protein n=1 Tax=Natronomonas sp. TaxID=2184060 RepID=UPI00261969CE|nr:hypothetical protein [Natronomonas sp.]